MEWHKSLHGKSPATSAIMLIRLPHPPLSFEVPQDWLFEAGVAEANVLSAASYRSSPSATIVSCHEVEPPQRNPGVTFDSAGFVKSRFLRALRGMVAGDDIPPIPVALVPEVDLLPRPYSLRPLGGYHRFYAALVLGYSRLPVDILR